MSSSPKAAEAPFDLQFLDTMTAHHQSAIEMAQMATKAQHNEIQALATAIVKDQQSEIYQMKVWRTLWFADKASAMNMQMPGMRSSMTPTHMNELKSATGDALDRHFIEGMIPHHEGAVFMCNVALPKLEHPELTAMCGSIIASRKAQVAQMKRWQLSWFPGQQ